MPVQQAGIGPQGRPPLRQSWRQPNMGHRDGGQRPIPDLLHQADECARYGREERRQVGHHHAFDLRLGQYLGQLVREQVDDNQHARAGIVELVDHFPRGVQRVGVHQHTAGLEHAEGHHWVAQAVGQLHRHAVATSQAKPLEQKGRKGVRRLINLREGQAAVHAVGHDACEGRLLGVQTGVGAAAFADQCGQAVVRGHGQLGLDTRSGIRRAPRLGSCIHGGVRQEQPQENGSFRI